MEATQAKEQKEMVAGLKKEQQRELDAFSSNMKQEQSELKKQVAAQFSDRKSRQNTFKSRKTQLDQHQKYKEGAFRIVQISFNRNFNKRSFSKWLEIKGIYAAFPISITLFINHLK